MNFANLKDISLNKLNILKLSSGTIGGQIITLISLPFLARIYGPEIFGTWALVIAVSMIITSFSDLGLSYSLMTVNENSIQKDYKVISTITLHITLISAFFLTYILFLFPNFFPIDNVVIFFFLVFFSSILSQQTQICYTWLNRESNYNVLMKNPVFSAFFSNILSLFLGLFGYIEYGYFLGYLCGQFIAFINMKRNLPKGIFTFNYAELVDVLNRNKDYIKFQMPTNFFNNIKSQIMVILINVFFGTVVLGYYSMTIRILQMPLTLLAKSIGRVFFQVISEMEHQSISFSNYVVNNLSKGMKLSIIPMALLLGVGDYLTSFIFGERWILAGEFVQILALQYFFNFLQSSVQGLSIVLKKQKNAMIANMSQMGFSIIALIVGKIYFDSIHIALYISMIFSILIHFLYFKSLFAMMNKSMRVYLFNVFKNISYIIFLAISLRLIVFTII